MGEPPADEGDRMIGWALAALALLTAAAWTCGSCLAPGATAAERLGAGALAIVGLAWATMIQGPAGVDLLAHPWLMRAIALVAVAALLAWRRPSLRPGRIDLAAAAVAAAATALVAYPGLVAATGRLWPSHEDMLWHQGWIRQLAAGAPAPGGVYAGEPNSYPWLYHSLAAWIAQALPGGLDAALAALDVAAIAAGWLGLWLLARALGAGRAAAIWAAGLFTAAAGFGWVWQHGPAAVLHQNSINLGPYHGDLVLYNALVPALGNVAPLLPRELAVCLSPLALWLLVSGLAPGRERLLWAAGAAVGFVFVIDPQAGGFCAAWGVALAAVARRASAWRAAAAAAAAAAVWLVPLAADYRRYGGFVSITHLRPIEPTAAETVIALGIVLPLGLAGAAAVAARPGGVMRGAVMALAAVPVAAVLLAAAAGGGELLGSPALLRWSRYLPYVVVGLCVPAGVAATRLTAAVRPVSRVLAAAVAAAMVAVAVPSTLLATAAVLRHPFPHGLTCTAWPAPDALTAVAARQPEADTIALALFSRTAAPALFLRRTTAKVRFRTWLDRPPSQLRRRQLRGRLVVSGEVPPGVSWVVADPALRVDRSGFVAAGSCRIDGRGYVALQRR
jgi:hypothetical protein